MRLNNICVIGLGYVGLTLAVTLAESGFEVFGVERDKEKLEQLRRGEPHFREKGLAELLQKYQGKNLHLFGEIPSDKKIDVFIIAVSTPVDKITKEPRIEYIERAVNEIIPHLEEGQLIVLRSTIPVGISRKLVLPKLRERCQNFYLSFCPERTAEGKALIELKRLPQVIGALNEESMFRSVELFSRVTSTIIKVSSLEAAEMIKLIDNTYRDLHFAFSNQVALICKDLNLDADEIIKAANFGYERNNIACPGYVGGTCLEKDPYILIHSAHSNCGFIRKGREVNENLPLHTLERVKGHLSKDKNSPLGEVKVFISGLAFKGDPETDDLRGSPSVTLLNLLKNEGIQNIYGHDFVVQEEYINKLGVKPCSLNMGFEGADVVIFMNNHRSYQDINIENLIRKMKKGGLFFDGWQLFGSAIKLNNHIKYESLGFKKTKKT